MGQTVSSEWPWSRKKRIPQSSNHGRDSGHTNAELPQHQRETQIDLGVNGKVSALAVTRGLVRIQLDENFLPTEES